MHGNRILGSYTLCLRSTVCPGSSDPFYVVSNYIKWVLGHKSYPFYILSHYKKKNYLLDTQYTA